MKRMILAGALILSTSLSYAATISMSFNQNQFTGTQGQNAQNAFLEAAGFWESILDDNVVVDLDINYAQLSPGVLGGASSRRVVQSYDSVLGRIQNDATSPADDFVLNNTPFACNPNSLGQCDNVFKEAGGVDSDGSNDNRFMSLTSANAKALGYNVGTGVADGTITFNSDFNFDFDPSDGISGGLFDFVGIAIHEIGHTLGFVSGVDIVDQNPTLDLDPFAYMNTLDLFRYSSGDGIIDMTPGVDSYLSLDGGVTEIIGFSTGVASGDGRQASHFKDNIGAGIMDPTFSPGQRGVLSEFDVLAFDIIGWDIAQANSPNPVNAPATGILLLSGLAMVIFRRKR